jgi:translation initiation factor 1
MSIFSNDLILNFDWNTVHMSKKKGSDKHGFVYSTDPNFQFQHEEHQAAETLLPQQQKLKVRLDTKQRAGKAVTLVDGFIGTEEDLQTLGKALKNYCGTGGSAKDREIIVQGDQRDKVLQWLLKSGYKNAKRVG